MLLIKAIILGLTQGLSEFIPVSSSGHLIVVGHLLHFENSGLVFDMATNLGTLAALIWVFWSDIIMLVTSLFKKNEMTRLAWLIIIATIPAVVLGVLLESKVETIFRSNVIVAANLIWVAFLMLSAERAAKARHGLEGLTPQKSFAIGCSQALALVPGVSRSGITISSGLLSGLDKVSATRFSFLLSAPIIAGATLKVLLKHDAITQIAASPGLYIAGILAAFIGGIIAIRFMLKYLSQHGLKVFIVYRIAFGILILLLINARVLV